MARAPKKSEVTRFKRVEPTAPTTATRPTRAKRASKNSPATEKRSAASAHPHIKAQIFGSILMLVGAWLFLALVLGILREKDHPLGPVLGKSVAEFVAWFFGAFPGLLFPFVVGLLGARIVAGAEGLRRPGFDAPGLAEIDGRAFALPFQHAAGPVLRRMRRCICWMRPVA